MLIDRIQKQKSKGKGKHSEERKKKKGKDKKGNYNTYPEPLSQDWMKKRS